MYKYVPLDVSWFISGMSKNNLNLFHKHRSHGDSWGTKKKDTEWFCRKCKQKAPINISIIADILFCESYNGPFIHGD